MRSRALVVPLLGIVAAQTNCGAPATVAPKAVDVPVPAVVEVLPSWTAAHWDYHPAAPETFRAYVRNADGSCVLVADGGQRWTTAAVRKGDAASDAAPCTGGAQASGSLAPEDLVAVVRRSSSAWAFVSAKGVLYEASDPLAAFNRATPPPEPLRKVVGTAGNLAAVARSGALFYWEDEIGWKPAAPTPQPVYDVLLGDGGAGLALAFPEALFATQDGGRSWAPLTLPKTVGAARLGRLAEGPLAAEGLYESLVWDPARTPDLSARAVPIAPQPEPAVRASRAASATAVFYERARIDDERYFEVTRPEEEPGPWVLLRGRIEGRLLPLPIEKSEDCQSLSFGVRGEHLVAVCGTYENDDMVARVLRSKDRGSTWKTEGSYVFADVDAVDVALAPDGSALLTGVCKKRDEKGGACLLLLRQELGKPLEISPRVPPMRSGPTAPAFSLDGRSAYLLGRRIKDERPAIYVSHDGGETFVERVLEAPSASARIPTQAELDQGFGSEEGSGAELPLGDGASIQPTDEGVIGVTLSVVDPAEHLLVDEDGRVVGRATPPTPEALVAGFGRRLMALGPRDTASEMARGFGLDVPSEAWVLTVWESLDGGTTWTPIPGSVPLAREYYDGTSSLACGAGGCVFGETVSRVGWGAQSEPPRLDFARPAAGPKGRDPVFATPIVCELGATSKWSRIEHVYGENLPTEDDAMRGQSVWSVLTEDRATGETKAVAAMLPEGGTGPARVVTKVLLGRKNKAVPTLTKVSPQMEGYAAVRMPAPSQKPGEAWGKGTPRIEIAWENFMDGTAGRRALNGALTRGNVEDAYLRTGLVSVSPASIFVQPHVGSPRVFWLDQAKIQDEFSYPLWPTGGLRGEVYLRSDDAVFIDKTQVAVGFVDQDNDAGAKVVLLAARPPGAMGRDWPVSATAMAPDSADVFATIDWTYAGARLGVTAFMADPELGNARAFFSPFQGVGTFGPAEPLPTQLDLPATPKGCSSKQRASTARFEAPVFASGSSVLFAGTRHPVIIHEASTSKDPAAVAAPTLLLTSASVLHGTPADPCVAGYHAVGLLGTPLAAILPGDLAEAWLFRKGPVVAASAGSDDGPNTSIEYRPMTCHFDASAKVPEVMLKEPGMSKEIP